MNTEKQNLSLIEMNERLINYWEILLDAKENASNTKLLEKLKEEQQLAKIESSRIKHLVFNGAVLLYKLKDSFNFKETKQLNKFNKDLITKGFRLPSETINRFGDSKNVHLDNRYNEWNYESPNAVRDVFVKNNIVQTIEHNQRLSLNRYEIQTQVKTEVIGKNIMLCNNEKNKRTALSKSKFVLWDIEDNHYLSWQEDTSVGEFKNKHSNDHNEGKKYLQDQISFIKADPFVSVVVDHYFYLVDEVIEDKLSEVI